MFETVCLERIQQFDDPIIPDEDDVCFVVVKMVDFVLFMCCKEPKRQHLIDSIFFLLLTRAYLL